MKKRGYPVEALNNFIDLINVKRSGNENIIEFKLLEFCIRKYLDKTATRFMCVLNPVKLIINNVPNDFS